jgi:2,3-bisphosphoglycerate-dependent phosphoglycerate mutase
MSLLVLVRHGQSAWNLENRFTGEVDVDLTPLGRQEAINAGKQLKDIIFDYAFTSVLKRAEETLQLMLKQFTHGDIPIARSQALNERNYGTLQGLNKAQTAERYGAKQVEIWRRSYATAPPGGESLQQTAARVIPYYQQAVEPLLKKGDNILIVAHGNSLRALMMHLENISQEAIAQIDIPTATPRQYVFDTKMELVFRGYL